MGRDNDHRFQVPPPGFVVLREAELSPEGRADRWVARGIIDGRSIIRGGLRSHSSACRSSWFAYEDACELGATPRVVNVAEVDSLVAEALARRFAIRRERDIDPPAMKTSYTVSLDSWDHMEADLLAQVIADAGSARRAAKVINVPRSTLSARVRVHRARGTWPT